MAKPAKAKSARRSKPLYHSAKISDYQFKKALWHFVLDDTAAETARHINLSINSISVIWGKLRKFFFEVGLFMDIYQGGDPADGSALAEPEFERRLIEFHLKRSAAKRGLNSPPSEPDYHFAESHWRFHFAIMNEGRATEAVHAMMFGHLLEIIRICGPVGSKPLNQKQGLLAVFRQMEQRLLWMERNSQDYRLPTRRRELRSIREIQHGGRW
ncbi:hypothetical protein [Rhizobium sp. CF142]|uniref:hypothetical protein n=1 Tax=Rhizobium sp. CF142 TaxID=1144314 RepID=UPI00026F02D1|nr:hypothetical protein [Rhizobium sp. CF142]EJJ27311.1 hypothetical protein PMI11_04323 [Rhizobium sp. CF142]